MLVRPGRKLALDKDREEGSALALRIFKVRRAMLINWKLLHDLREIKLGV